jgi:hypothetical protein
MKTDEKKIERIRKYATSTATSFKKYYYDEDCQDDREEILGQIIIYDNVETMIKEADNQLYMIKNDISKTLINFKELYNEARFEPTKNLFWGYILALETIELLLEFDELKEDTK